MSKTASRLADNRALSGGLKAWQLKYCAFLIGTASTGPKHHLETSILARLAERKPPKEKCRILSVDMGIRNLAYCVIDAQLSQPQLKASRVGASKTNPTRSPPNVVEWQRLDVLADPTDPSPGGDKKAVRQQIANEAFTPSALSRTAYKITQTLLSHRPDVILIERQRFRSGGASAIQEWTVRVNMLESMLWACLETLKHSASPSGSSVPAVYEVSPKRVGSFWTACEGVGLGVPDDILSDPFGEKGTEVLKGVKKKVEKKDKIAVLKSWLRGDGDVHLRFSDDVKGAVGLFNIATKDQSGDGDIKSPAKRTPAGKLDDLADCMLQAMAWVRWEENSRKLKHLGEEEKVWHVLHTP